MTRDPDFKADLARYPARAFLKEQSIWAIYYYRLGRRLVKQRPGVLRNIQLKVYWQIFRIVETMTGISLPPTAKIGPGLRIYHFGNIFIHGDAVLGRNCTLRQGVTVGNTRLDGPVPVIEDDVEFGAYAQVLGHVHVGRGARIGAMSVVLNNVPPLATVVGVPARIVCLRRKDGSNGISSELQNRRSDIHL
jgi:serine O-acetyltransferase